MHPAFASGQDSFLASLETKGVRDETYWQAVEFCNRSAGVEGIDVYVGFLFLSGEESCTDSRVCRALKYNKTDGTIGTLDGLLVPSDVGQSYQVAAQAGSSLHLRLHRPFHSVCSHPFHAFSFYSPA